MLDDSGPVLGTHVKVVGLVSVTRGLCFAAFGMLSPARMFMALVPGFLTDVFNPAQPLGTNHLPV